MGTQRGYVLRLCASPMCCVCVSAGCGVRMDHQRCWATCPPYLSCLLRARARVSDGLNMSKFSKGTRPEPSPGGAFFYYTADGLLGSESVPIQVSSQRLTSFCIGFMPHTHMRHHAALQHNNGPVQCGASPQLKHCDIVTSFHQK